jgi:hypothetical protein
MRYLWVWARGAEAGHPIPDEHARVPIRHFIDLQVRSA